MNRRPIGRGLLALAAALVMAGAATIGLVAGGEGDVVAFFVVGDTHYKAEKGSPDTLDVRMAAMAPALIDTLNRLPGEAIPERAGGGRVKTPRGLIHAGDCIDSGDTSNLPATKTEWAGFTRDFGLTGQDGRLRFPTYEVHGNHDGPRGAGFVIEQIQKRNAARHGVVAVSQSGVHYSWDWGPVHFVNVGNIVGGATINRKRRYEPLDSLKFLIDDLKKTVGDSGRPVVITHHVDLLRYSQPLPIADQKAEAMEWDPADVRAFFDAIKGYNVAAIFYGHTHSRNIYRWNGAPKAASEGIPVFNVTKASHYSGKTQGFFYIEIAAKRLTAREYQTTDGWQTGKWTPMVWTVKN